MRRNKHDFVDALHANGSYDTKTDAEHAVRAVFGALADCLAAGDEVAVPQFGTFSVRHRAARSGVNPATGTRMPIAARNSPHIKPAKALREKLN